MTKHEAIKWLYENSSPQFVIMNKTHTKPIRKFKNYRRPIDKVLPWVNDSYGLAIVPESIGFYVIDVDNKNCEYSDVNAIQYKSLGKNDGTHYWYQGYHQTTTAYDLCRLGHKVKDQNYHKCGDWKGSENSYVALRGSNVVELVKQLQEVGAVLRVLPGKTQTIRAVDPARHGRSSTSNRRKRTTLELAKKDTTRQTRPYLNKSAGEMIEEAVLLKEGTRYITCFELISEWCYQRYESIKAGTITLNDVEMFAMSIYQVIQDKEGFEYEEVRSIIKKVYKWVNDNYKETRQPPDLWRYYAHQFKQGIGPYQIAKNYNVSPSAVYHALTKLGLYIPKSKRNN